MRSASAFCKVSACSFVRKGGSPGHRSSGVIVANQGGAPPIRSRRGPAKECPDMRLVGAPAEQRRRHSRSRRRFPSPDLNTTVLRSVYADRNVGNGGNLHVHLHVRRPDGGSEDRRRLDAGGPTTCDLDACGLDVGTLDACGRDVRVAALFQSSCGGGGLFLSATRTARATRFTTRSNGAH